MKDNFVAAHAVLDTYQVPHYTTTLPKGDYVRIPQNCDLSRYARDELNGAGFEFCKNYEGEVVFKYVDDEEDE